MSLIEELYKQIQSDIEDNTRHIVQLDNVADVAGTASTVPTCTLTQAPLLADGQKGYALRFISDGRKSGEGAGLGTGCLGYYDPATDSWLNVRDDLAVQV